METFLPIAVAIKPLWGAVRPNCSYLVDDDCKTVRAIMQAQPLTLSLLMAARPNL